jgi:hypothetical protein
MISGDELCGGRLTILDLIKIYADINKDKDKDKNKDLLCWYFKLFPYFIQNLTSKPINNSEPIYMRHFDQKTRLKVFDYILRKKLCTTISKDNKKFWPVPDGYFTPLLAAIKYAKIEHHYKNLPPIDVQYYTVLRKDATRWFGGKTKRRTRRTRGRKTKRRKLSKR